MNSSAVRKMTAVTNIDIVTLDKTGDHPDVDGVMRGMGEGRSRIDAHDLANAGPYTEDDY